MLNFRLASSSSSSRLCERLRQLSTQHYDSQSGMTYEISDRINVFLLQPSLKGESVRVPPHVEEVMEQQKLNVDSIAVRCGNPDDVSTALSQLQVSKFPKKRCTIIDAFSSPSSLVQTVSAKLCDAGCTQLILAESNHRDCDNPSKATMADVDENDVREVVEAVLWNDVVGTPMSERVGLRASGASTSHSDSSCAEYQTQIEEALELNVKHFDASLDGVSAPSWNDLITIFDNLGLKHNLAPDDCESN